MCAVYTADHAIITLGSLSMVTIVVIVIVITAGVVVSRKTRFVYATADEADAYMFYSCFFSVFFCLFFVFFPSVKKYHTTVLGNG